MPALSKLDIARRCKLWHRYAHDVWGCLKHGRSCATVARITVADVILAQNNIMGTRPRTIYTQKCRCLRQEQEELEEKLFRGFEAPFAASTDRYAITSATSISLLHLIFVESKLFGCCRIRTLSVNLI
jgi:hypothetical protein